MRFWVVPMRWGPNARRQEPGERHVFIGAPGEGIEPSEVKVRRLVSSLNHKSLSEWKVRADVVVLPS
jgi:hypothetical protein